MDHRLLFVCFISLILLAGCGNMDMRSIEIELSNGEPGVYYLGMTFDEVFSLDTADTDFRITQIIEFEEGEYVTWTPSSTMLFDKDKALFRIQINGDFPSKIGLKNGDPSEWIAKKLGISDKTHFIEFSQVIEEYDLGDHYLYFISRDGSIILWGVSMYPYDSEDFNIRSKMVEFD